MLPNPFTKIGQSTNFGIPKIDFSSLCNNFICNPDIKKIIQLCQFLKNNEKKKSDIFHHNFTNILCYVTSEVSLKRFYFALFDDGLTLKTLKLAYIVFCIQTLRMKIFRIIVIFIIVIITVIIPIVTMQCLLCHPLSFPVRLCVFQMDDPESTSGSCLSLPQHTMSDLTASMTHSPTASQGKKQRSIPSNQKERRFSHGGENYGQFGMSIWTLHTFWLICALSH